MKHEVSNLENRLRELERAIVDNERRQRRLERALARGASVSLPSATRTATILPAKPEAPSTSGTTATVCFTAANASIFMSGNLEEARVRNVTPTESRNRRRVLAIFAAAVATGILYMVLRGA